MSQEIGARLKTKSEDLDYDGIDDYCDHLVAGYTRLLNQKQVQRLGRYYSQSEFNLERVLSFVISNHILRAVTGADFIAS